MLVLDLARLEPGRSAVRAPAEWTSVDPARGRIGGWGGSALSAAWLEEAAAEGASEPPLVLAIGECVRRGLPTAARASVASRGASSGRLAEGQIGGDLALRLTGVADAVVLRGRARRAGSVVVLGADGVVELVVLPELRSASPAVIEREVAARFGDCAVLRAGPAAHCGVPFATLVAGGEHPSHVGRGGLGAWFARAGLVALVVRADPLPASTGERGAGHAALLRALASSPRLRARGEGGTFELWQAFQARGELTSRNYTEGVSPEVAGRLWQESRASGRERKGCRGCPTPCGWVFERSGGAPLQGAHFGASWALGPNLGLERFDDALRLLALCDELGVDAKESGAVLALRARAGERGLDRAAPRYGEVSEFEDALHELGRESSGDRRTDARRGALGAEALAEALGLADELASASGQAAREGSDLAAVLGQCTSANGADPMRSFPFSTADGLDRDRIEHLLAGIPLPAGAEDPLDPRGKGRLVWWHENLVAAIDASGFCAFSAGGLLADGVCELDELAEWIAPAALSAESDPLGEAWRARSPGERLLAAGASIALLRRRLNGRYGADADLRPRFARERLDRPGMLDEYRRARGLDGVGVPRPEALELLATPALLDLGARALSAEDEPIGAGMTAMAGPRERAPGIVRLVGLGPLGERLGGEIALEFLLPASVADVVRAVADEHPAAAPFLSRDDRPIVAVYRGGTRLDSRALVSDGERLELAVAISGG